MTVSAIDEILSQSTVNTSDAPVKSEVVHTPAEMPEPAEAPEPVEEPVDSADEYGSPVESDDDDLDSGSEEDMLPRSKVQESVQKRLRREQKKYETLMAQQAQQYEDALRQARETAQQTREPAAQESAGEDWEKELETRMDRRISERQKQEEERNWQQEAERKTREFADRFQQGRAKYKDFDETIQTVGSYLTPTVGRALQGLDSNPAAFLYNAAKTHSDDLIKIFGMDDAVAQAAALGSLNAAMKKKKSTSSAPAPVGRDKGDYSVTANKKVRNSVDAIINQEENRRREAMQRR